MASCAVLAGPPNGLAEANAPAVAGAGFVEPNTDGWPTVDADDPNVSGLLPIPKAEVDVPKTEG